MSLLRRGVASYDATRYTDAAKQLRLAAFGLVDTIDQYQLAHMYLAMTLEKLGQKDRAADSARRVIAAERVERKYTTASAALRTAFEETAAKLLTPAELAMLRGGTIVPSAPPQTSSAPSTPARSATTTTTTPPRTSTPVPAPQTAAKPPATQPAAKPPVTQPQPDRAVVTPAQQTTRPENAAPQTATTNTPPAPAAAKPKPVVKPPTTTPASTTTSTTPPRTAPATNPPAPAARPLTANEIAARLASAERALSAANLTEARRGYRELLVAQGLDHDSMIRVAEGLYRARDFAGALSAFANLGTLRRGEEPYRYYIAVAAFETGDRARAKRELAAALPYIEVTPDVARYRSRIESAP